MPPLEEPLGGEEEPRGVTSAFAQAAAAGWPGLSGEGSKPPSSSTSRAHSGLPDALVEPQMGSQKSMSRQSSAGLFGRRPSAAQPELWRASRAVVERAQSLGLQSVRDLCGPSFIDAGRLRKPKALGEGAFAVVELAQLMPAAGTAAEDWPPSGAAAPAAAPRTVAVKRLKPHVLESEDDVVAFIQEARLLTRLRHPSIIEFIGLGTSDASCPEAAWRTMFLVQEYAEGGTLKRLILSQMINPTRKLYSLADAVRWAGQVAQGLAYLHALNPMILHRDLKSENVLLARDEQGQQQAKLADFGLHKLVRRPGARAQWSFSDIKEEGVGGSQHGGMDAAAALHLTANSSLVRPSKEAEDLEGLKYELTGRTGAYVYMAPEVLLGSQYNEKVDVFSLGMVLYELLHRKMVVADLMYLGDAEDAEAFAYKVAAGYRLPIGDEVPAPLAKLVSECLAGKPELRPSMKEVVARLQDCARSGELEAVEHMHGPSGRTAACCALM